MYLFFFFVDRGGGGGGGGGVYFQKNEGAGAGFSLGILKHASRTPCLAQIGVPE